MSKGDDKKCKTCEYWKNHQREINFQENTGFCVNPKFKFNTSVGRLIGVFDADNRINRTQVSGVCTHDIETLKEHGVGVEVSRYLLQTDEEFGCIYHKQKSK